MANLNSQDLLFLSDNDGLKPLLLPFFNHNELDPRFTLALKRIHKELEVLSKRTISQAKKISTGIELIEVPPAVGIFRGCIGGDCSSQYSFPYPNDPHERVFLIKKLKPGLKEGDNDQLKGYVAATEVIVNGEPALYVVTISGVNISAADTELVLRGLDEAKEKLGVKLIVLPTPEKLNGLINFPAIRGVYQKHLNKNSTRVTINYQDPDIRNEIQKFRPYSGYNNGYYDHMNSNMNGTVLSFISDKNVSITMTSIKLVQNDASLLDPDNIFDFIYELNKSKRKNIIKRILEIDEVVKLFGPGSAEKIDNLFRLIGSDSVLAKQKKMKTLEFRQTINSALNNLNFKLSNSYIDKFAKLMHDEYLFYEDAFSKDNTEKTAVFFNNSKNSNIKESILEAMLIENRVELFKTREFARLTIFFYENLGSKDHHIYGRALKFFENAPAIDDQTFQKLIGIITNSKLDLNFRETAIKAFNKIKPNDYAMLTKSLLSCFSELSLSSPARKVLTKIGLEDPIVIEILISSLKSIYDDELRMEIIKVLQTLLRKNSQVAIFMMASNPIVLEALVKRLYVGRADERTEIISILGALTTNNPQFASEIANNSIIIENFCKRLNKAYKDSDEGLECEEIIRVIRTLAANNPIIINVFISGLTHKNIIELDIIDSFENIGANDYLINALIKRINRPYTQQECLEITRRLHKLAAKDLQAANVIVNEPLYIARLNRASKQEVLEILKNLEALAVKNPQVANEIANNPIVIKFFIESLKNGPENMYITDLLRALAANNPQVAIEVFIKPLNRYMFDSERVQMIKALGELAANNPIVIEALIKHSINSDFHKQNIFEDLLRTLVDYTPLVYEIIIKCINDGSDMMRLGATNLLRTNKINTAEFFEALNKWLKQGSSTPSMDIIRWLEEIGLNHPLAFEAMIKCINVGPNDVCLAAINSLRILKPNAPRLIEAMIKCLNDRDDTTRRKVIFELKEIIAKHPELVEQAMDYLKQHVDYNVRETAKELFGDEYRKFFARSADCNLL